MAKQWSDEASTESLPVPESREYADQHAADPPLWLMKILFVVVTVAAIAASIAVAVQMSNRSVASAPAVDALRGGECLTWPAGAPERAMQVDCADEHLFEVADSRVLQAGSDSGNHDADVEHQQICTRAVASSLGSHYDPGGRFVVGAVSTPGRLLCGLQLPSDGVASIVFRGRIAEQDQSRVWQTGTCLGIRDGQTTEIPVQCALPHALEITGAIDLSGVFDLAAPSVAAQDAVVRDACGRATSQYLSPVSLEATSLTLRYQPIEAKGWNAGSRRIACRIGSEKPGGGWATLLGAAKAGLLIDGRPVATPPNPVAPPPSPAELPSPAEPPPAETTAPVIEAQQSAPGPVPHMVDAEEPGPPPAPGPAEEAPSTEAAPPPLG